MVLLESPLLLVLLHFCLSFLHGFGALVSVLDLGSEHLRQHFGVHSDLFDLVLGLLEFLYRLFEFRLVLTLKNSKLILSLLKIIPQLLIEIIGLVFEALQVLYLEIQFVHFFLKLVGQLLHVSLV